MNIRAFRAAWKSAVDLVAARVRRAGRIVASAAAVLALVAPGARAEMVYVEFDGLITKAEPAWNTWLTAHQGLALRVSYDDSEYDGVGVGVITFSATNSNTLYVGTSTIDYMAEASPRYSSGEPLSITLEDGKLIDTNLVLYSDERNPFGFGILTSRGLDFEAFYLEGGRYPIEISGRWNAVVPEPSSVLLLGAASVGLVGWVRRRSPDA